MLVTATGMGHTVVRTWGSRDRSKATRPLVGTNDATVCVVDDDPEVREALTRLLRSAGWRVETFDGAGDFLGASDRIEVGCVLLDVAMPDMPGPELHALMRQRGIALPVIYLTGRCSVSISVQAMKQGALDFLEKPVDADALLPAIDQAVERSRQELERSGQLRAIRQRVSTLSAREREVLDHVIGGRLNKQIAADLGIAEKTVKVHRGRMMAKMGVRSVAELVHHCDELGLAAPRVAQTA